MTRDRRLGLLLLMACGVFVFHRALFLGETFVDRDLRAYYRPAKSLLVPLTSASSGLPLWNPFFASGQPFAANPEHEVFHPATWIFFVLPFEWAFRLQVIVPPFLAAAGMIFLLRTLGRSGYASLFGGLAWGFGGYLLSTTNLIPCLLAVTPLPYAAAFVVRLARGGGATNAAGLSAAAGLMALVAEPSTLLASPLVLGPALLAGVAGQSRRDASRAVLVVAGAGLLGLALGAAALFPGFALSRKTARAGGLEPANAYSWSMPPARLVELVLPRALGHPERDDERWYWGAPLYPGKRFPFYMSLYPGLLAGVLGGVAWWRGKRELWPWAAGALLGGLLATGSHLPVFPLVRELVLPLRQIRFPEKFILPFLFAWCVAAARGFDLALLDRRDRSSPARRALLVLGGASILAALGALVASPSLWIALGAAEAIASELGRTAGADLLRVSVLAIAGAALLRLCQEGRKHRAAAGLLAVAAVDLATAGRPLIGTSPIDRERAAPPPIRQVLAHAPGATVFHLGAYTDRGLRQRIKVGPPMPSFWGLANALEGDFDLTELSWSAEATRRFWDVVNKEPKLMATLLYRRGVTAVVRGTKRPDAPLEAVFPVAARPFATAVSRVERFDGGPGWVSKILELEDEARESACVDRSEGPLPVRPSPATVTTAERTPVRVRLDVEAAGPEPAFVAIGQTWDTGWIARVDGSTVPLVRADLSLSGVVVPPGRHRLTLDYRDPWVTRGVAVSLAAALATALLALLGRRRAAPSVASPEPRSRAI